MRAHYESAGVTLFHGDCLDVLRQLPDESVHAVVTDPPYGLEFMGKDWDSFKPGGKRPQIGEADGTPFRRSAGTPSWAASGNPRCRNCGGTKYDRTRPSGCTCAAPNFPNESAAHMHAFQEWCTQWATECHRVVKPGGYLLAFGGSRTWHRLAAGVEDAGFEIRDSIAWLYAQGFPKSLDVAKAIDATVLHGGSNSKRLREAEQAGDGETYTMTGKNNGIMGETVTVERKTWQPETDQAKVWDGWGTALKPAFEPIVVARKPLIGTVASNVLAHGTGALNIDVSRVGDGSDSKGARASGEASSAARYTDRGAVTLAATPGPRGGSPKGRWPANVVLDESQAAELDEQAPDTGGSGAASGPSLTGATAASASYGARNGVDSTPFYGGERGGASRMFPTFHYEAKAPTSERPVVDGVAHPTVKPLDLMQWLVRLVTPKGGTVLEPFAGSGTTVEACLREGFDVIAIEREADYLPLIEKRIRKDHAQGLDFDWGEAS